MGFVRDTFNALRDKPITDADVVSNSTIDIIRALEKRAVDDSIVGSIAKLCTESVANLETIKTRVTAEIGHNDDIQTLLGRVTEAVARHSQFETLLSRIVGNVGTATNFSPTLSRLTSTRATLLDNLQHMTQEVADRSSITTLLGRLTSDRADLLDNLDTLEALIFFRSQATTFTSDTAWNRPTGVQIVRVTIIGGGKKLSNFVVPVNHADDSAVTIVIGSSSLPSSFSATFIPIIVQSTSGQLPDTTEAASITINWVV